MKKGDLLMTKTGRFNTENSSLGRTAMTGLGATALAAPFLMGGDDEDEGPIDQRSTEAARNGLERYQLGWDTFWETDFLAADWLLEPLLAKGRTHSIVAAAKAEGEKVRCNLFDQLVDHGELSQRLSR